MKFSFCLFLCGRGVVTKGSQSSSARYENKCEVVLTSALCGSKWGALRTGRFMLPPPDGNY
jgi:hypothetical protein